MRITEPFGDCSLWAIGAAVFGALLWGFGTLIQAEMRL
jgi:hypothetical protein